MVEIVKNLPAKVGDARDADLTPGSGRSLEKEMATHSSISCLGKSMDRGGKESNMNQHMHADAHVHTHTDTHRAY